MAKRKQNVEKGGFSFQVLLVTPKGDRFGFGASTSLAGVLEYIDRLQGHESEGHERAVEEFIEQMIQKEGQTLDRHSNFASFLLYRWLINPDNGKQLCADIRGMILGGAKRIRVAWWIGDATTYCTMVAVGRADLVDPPPEVMSKLTEAAKARRPMLRLVTADA